MVLTRSRAASPTSAGALSEGMAPPAPVAPASEMAPHGAAADSAATQVAAVDPQLAAAAAAAPVTMSTEQLLLLINRLSRSDPVSTPVYSGHSGHFAKCTARFDGEKSSNVLAFIDAVETYKECVGVDDHNALRGLPMLLTGLAATWWQGVKDTTVSWQVAVESLKQTFGPRLPPHKVYRKIFEREQRVDEATDLFVCHIRALIAQLPPFLLPEVVQVDMAYGLLNHRIREKLPRTAFNTFAEMLTQARRIEDILDEFRPRVPADRKPPIQTSASSPTPRSAAVPSTSKIRPHCNYCKQYGHVKESCQRLAKQKKVKDGTVEGESPPTTSSVTCFGCGAPGVIRSNCSTCKEKKLNTSSIPFQSVSACGVESLDPRSRPKLNIKIYGESGSALLDTGAKLSIASVSLKNVLVKNGTKFVKTYSEIKLADGSVNCLNVETAMVDVHFCNRVVPTHFIVLPGAVESLLGIDFIRDAGMVLDFHNNSWSLEGSQVIYPILYEEGRSETVCASFCLRDDEGTLLQPSERIKLVNLLESNKDIFEPGGGPTTFALHRIDTGNSAPISVPPYRVTPAKKEIIRKEIDRMLEEEVIEEAESPWASPVVLVPKKNGEIRFCVDYRALNRVTKTDKYPLPVIDEVLQSTKANSVMSTIDLKAGYWQIEVAPEDRDKTTFTSPFGMFRFRRMPFGLKNSPSTFQRLIDRFRAGLKNITVVAYLDDILVISEDLESHVKDLQQVFERLRLFNLKANRSKCVFARDKVTYLGHVISARGIEPDPTKVEVVVNMKPPTNLKEMKTFLQTCSWFRKFIPQFSEVARPLTDLTKKDRRWKWGDHEQRAFEELKLRLSTSPILCQPSFEKPFVLRTDASAYALGAVLMQGENPTEERPIEYASRLLTSAERNYHTTEREALAVVWALDKFRGYIEGAQTRVATDHQPLKWLLSLKTPSGRLARWAMKIQCYNLDIEYTPGRVNLVADTLSRPVNADVEEPSSTSSCSICPVIVDLPQRKPEDIRGAQLKDSEVNKIIEDFESSNNSDAAMRWTDRGYYLSQGVLYRCNPDGDSEEPQLVVPESLRAELMKELHDSPTAGHLGLERTLRKIKEKYFFRNMRTYVAQYLKSCDLCQKYKATNLKPAGLLQTPVPQQRFEVLAMDLFGPLPEGNKGEKWILLVEDTASRWVELFALCDATAESCAKALIEEVFMRYGFPRRVISDNGTQFVSAVMQKAMHVLGVQQSLTPVYHPEANPAERKNREMKKMLAILLDPEHRRWPEVLPAVRFALNTAYNEGTGHSAAFLTFAREFRSPVDVAHDLRAIVEQENYVPQISPYLRDFVHRLQEVRWRVEHQQDIRKEAADKHRRAGPSYQEGDLVLVDSHRLSQAAKGFTSKFAPRREGPYRIGKVVSPTTYEVVDKDKVPRGRYHASLLTPYVGDSDVVVHNRKKGRPRKVLGSKPAPATSADLEGEIVARSINSRSPQARTLQPPQPSRRSARISARVVPRNPSAAPTQYYAS